ncbi:hypothetical protein D3C71_277490 [compost metagenome]
MNKIQVSLFEVHPVTREKIAEHVTVIETDEYGPNDLPEFFKDNLADIRSQAAKAVASRSVDYDSFGSDSAYLDRIDQVAETLYLSDVSIPNALTRAYDMEGIYPGDGGLWGDVEHGACQGEAEFRALWTMSVNDGFEIDPESETPDEAVTSLQDFMEDQELTGMCQPLRPKAADAEELLKKLAEIARNGSEDDLRRAVVDGAAEFIGKLHEVVSDEIVLLPEAEADAAPAAAL